MPVYIIDNLIHFDTELRTFHLAENMDRVINIGYPSAQCLELLIKNKGSILSKEEITNHIWGQFGLHVGDNSYYQMVLNLRKSLSKTGIAYGLINTVPRKGLMLPSYVQVVESEPAVADLEAGTEPTLDHDVAVSAESDITPLDDSGLTVISTATTKQQFRNKIIHNSFIAIFLAAIPGYFLLSTIDIPQIRKIQHWDWSEYNVVQHLDKCKIYSNNEEIKDNKRIINSIIPECATQPFVYVKTFKYVKRISIISCARPIQSSEPNECLSNYWITK